MTSRPRFGSPRVFIAKMQKALEDFEEKYEAKTNKKLDMELEKKFSSVAKPKMPKKKKEVLPAEQAETID